jgi:tetratricopeptide (TPR) repeat protein
MIAPTGAYWIDMNYDKLDDEELLRLALGAMNENRDADSVVMLKTLLERDPDNVHAQYLLAAQHAQMGMFDRAEAGFRSVVANAPELATARFQLAQLLLMKGATKEAAELLRALTAQSDALGAYARALGAVAVEDMATAAAEIEAGLVQPQEIPALAADMRRLLDQWREAGIAVANTVGMAAASPMFLAGYGRDS